MHSVILSAYYIHDEYENTFTVDGYYRQKNVNLLVYLITANIQNAWILTIWPANVNRCEFIEWGNVNEHYWHGV